MGRAGGGRAAGDVIGGVGGAAPHGSVRVVRPRLYASSVAPGQRPPLLRATASPLLGPAPAAPPAPHRARTHVNSCRLTA
jgi:hypothetical protein